MSFSIFGVGVGFFFNYMFLFVLVGMIMFGGVNCGGFVKLLVVLEFGNVIGEMGNYGDDEKLLLFMVEGKLVSSGNVEVGCGVRSLLILFVLLLLLFCD